MVELDLTETDLRVDGLPRANARMGSDAVRISFQSKHGPLRYETGEFAGAYYRDQVGWQANIRAIALGLESLRRVDRYGISRRGEQYRGWNALTTGTDPADAIQTRDQALSMIARTVGRDIDGTGDLRDAIRDALKATHPDAGGDATEFRKVMKAKQLLGV